MKLLRVGPPGAERPVVPDGTRFLDMSGVVSDIGEEFWRLDGVDRIRAALAAHELPEVDITGRRFGPPITRPGAVLCIGMGYEAHAAETGSQPPEHPVMFYKAPNTVVGPDDDVLLPQGSDRTDWKVELTVVIGRRARYPDSPAHALSYVGGYCVSNDVSERALQLETSAGQWSKGKSCETSNPLGPWLVTADEVPDPQSLRLRTNVNGEGRQNSSTADMVNTVTQPQQRELLRSAEQEV